ncbi:MAG: EamA/RhaT family transporter [Aquificaceae bacterium]|nr:MAG: EamA/RhaT family transporter [Aquificaceae bacterium]
MKTETTGMVLGFIGVAIFSLTLPATRYIAAYFDPLFIGLGRASVAAIIAMIILLIFKQPFPNKQQAKQLAITATGVIVGFPVLTSWAMKTVDASHAGVVIALIPLLTAVFARFISGERPSIAFWIVSGMGATLVASYALLEGNFRFQIGDLLLIAASLLGALGYAVGGKLSQELGGWQVICWALVISFPFILIPTLMTQPNDYSSISPSVWINFLYLALMSQLFGFFLWYKGLAMGGIARVSQIQLLQPFLTIIASVLFLGESLNNRTIIFAIAVVSMIAISRKMPIKNKENTQ